MGLIHHLYATGDLLEDLMVLYYSYLLVILVRLSSGFEAILYKGLDTLYMCVCLCCVLCVWLCVCLCAYVCVLKL